MHIVPLLASGQGMIGLMLVAGLALVLFVFGAEGCQSKEPAKKKKGELLIIAAGLLLLAAFFLFPLIVRYL